jgi:uncharacterized protein YceK
MGGSIDDRVFYRGVRADLESIEGRDPAMAVLATVDLPLSAVADTLLAPILVPVWLTSDRSYSNAIVETSKNQSGPDFPK